MAIDILQISRDALEHQKKADVWCIVLLFFIIITTH